MRDVSSVEELEDTLNFSRIMARQGRLLSGIGHQLRNPLQAVGIQLELLADDVRLGLPLNERIDGIRGELGRITRTISSLLRFIRLDRLEVGSFSLPELLREITLRHVPSDKYRVDFQLDSEIGNLEADRALLAEALGNIFANAAEAMPDGGTIKISTALAGPEGVEIMVADEGSGIDPDHLNSIYDFCFTTKPNGAGIGLPMALRIVDLHHGTLEISSAQGRGTMVRIMMPLIQASTTTEPNSATDVRVGKIHA
jgi:signal transduction histidine kinase